MSWQAEALKEKGNAHFKKGEWASAEDYYSQAIQKNSNNPLLWTNRAKVNLKLERWELALRDSERSTELLPDNMKAFFCMAQAQLALHLPREALKSATTAYGLCCNSKHQTSSAQIIAALVLECKKANWEVRERQRLRGQSELLVELLDILEKDKSQKLSELKEGADRGEIGPVELRDRREEVTVEASKKTVDLQSIFAISDPQNLTKREVPDHLIDPITFEIMHDPVITKNGNSYERATIIEHLKRSATDPLTREPLTIAELRPNIALRNACTEFMETNSGWSYDW